MFDLSSIKKEAVHKAPRIVIAGVPGIGKTTFAAKYEKVNGVLTPTSESASTVIIPIRGEEGADNMKCGKTPTVNSFDELIGWIGTLHDEDHEYDTVVIDSATRLESLIFAKVCEEKGWSSIQDPGYGKGPAEALVHWNTLVECLNMLREKGIATILTTHVVDKDFNDPLGPSYHEYKISLSSGAESLLNEWSDFVLFANRKTVVKTEKGAFNKEEKKGKDLTGNRYLYTDKRPGHPGKCRTQLPYELPLSWQAFKDAIANAQTVTQG